MQPLEIPLQHADQIDHCIGFANRLAHLGGAAYVGSDELDLADRSERLQEEGGAGIALGDPDPHAGAEQGLGDIAAEEAAAAEQGDQTVHLESLRKKPLSCAAPCPSAPALASAGGGEIRALTAAGRSAKPELWRRRVKAPRRGFWRCSGRPPPAIWRARRRSPRRPCATASP